ncbi:MAG: fatty acid desaturase [Actinomycetia bacterium]|nr:fatty acid desaturase [Actinomycetes bacterium]
MSEQNTRELLGTSAEPPPPALAALGRDLLQTSAARRRLTLARPYAGVAAFALAAWQSWWWLTPPIVFLTFVAVVTVTHDVVHGTLGLSRRTTDLALFLLGLVVFESGHAYAASHLQHHRLFPHPDDPEGHPADLSVFGAICYGPFFLPRLWCWAFNHARAYRGWLIAEALPAPLALITGLVLWPAHPGLLVYTIGVIIGSWVYPLLTVHLPHRHYGRTPLTRTHTLRGRIVPALFLELTYHLEHHLYPQVPSHHLPELAKRLSPFFDQAGVRPWRVI